ncbi:MAG TPA: carboxypeptidase regulatory-like domain-containing protein [Candidatus Solibacter sp.]|nr:carboxypeptidase regulatory-like domain-containing protein [Candidatus Solibacter sp.]
MRALFVVVALLGTAAAQSALIVSVTDENGVAVASARVFLQSSTQPSVLCQTDFTGRCRFPLLPAGAYQLRVEKPGYYALLEQNVQAVAGGTIEVAIAHQQEVRQVVDVHESPLAIDPAQVSAQESISGLDIVDIVYPTAHDYRNVLNFIPGVVQDQNGQPHVAGAQTYQTQTLLDGFNVTQPANGQLLVRVSTDAFRSIQVVPSREPAEDGKGSGGVLHLNTGIGDDHFRFYATNFVPSIQNKHGWRFDQFLPLFTFSGPIVKKKIWFYNAFDGEYDNTIYTALPVGADNDHALRIGNLSKLQTNITSRNILTSSFLVNYLHDQYAFLSPQSPQLSNPKDVESTYVASVKDQHYFAGGQLLESGFAYSEYDIRLTPYGALPYTVNPSTTSGSYYLSDETHAVRWQGIVNLFFPSRQWHGRHDFKIGTDLDRISYGALFARQPISFLTAAQTSLPASETCLNATQDQTFPCTRYSTFTAAPLHREFNGEITAYAEDRWAITNRLLLEPGIRLDWDQIVRQAEISPRLAGTYVLDNAGETKISAGVGLVYDSTPIYLIARPFAGTRDDTFYSIEDPTCIANCVTTSAPVTTTFSVNQGTLQMPRFLNWSLGLEKKLPRAIYLKAEFFERHGSRGFVYNTLGNTTGGNFVLENTRDDRYDAFQITARHNFRGSYMIMGSYTRSRARSNQALDFNVDSPILSAQQSGPYSWDTPNRFLSWGYLPFFPLPIVHQLELAYSMEARTGFPFSEFSDQQELLGSPGAYRFPFYFALNLQLEKRFHLFHNDWAVRGGFDNITGRCDPLVVNSVIDATHPLPTFQACLGRAFTSRIRLLGKK